MNYNTGEKKIFKLKRERNNGQNKTQNKRHVGKKNNIYVISVPEAGDKERKQVKSNI